MRVKELSDRTGVEPHVIRYYTRLGLLHPVREQHNRYRTFSSSDIYRVRFIRGARWLGFTLNDIQSILSDADRGVSPCPEVRNLIAVRAGENARRLATLNRLQHRMEQAIEQWSVLPDRTPTNDSLCHLIDLVAGEHDQLT